MKKNNQNWQLETGLVQHIAGKGTPYPMFDYGAYAQHNVSAKIRIARTTEEKAERMKLKPTVAELYLAGVIDKAEYLKETGELPHLDKNQSPSSLGVQKRVRWVSGNDFYQINKESNSEFVKVSKQLGLPLQAGISGTTDHLLTLSGLLGLHSKNDMELLRLNLIAWMVPEDHSIHEIMTSSKSFGMPYHPRSDGYKDILSNDSELKKPFMDILSRKLSEKGLRFPEYYLSKDCLTSKIGVLKNSNIRHQVKN